MHWDTIRTACTRRIFRLHLSLVLSLSKCPAQYGWGTMIHWARTFWQTVDSSAIAGISSTVLKYAFSRARPYQGNNPDLWFQGSCCKSFPSGEVTRRRALSRPSLSTIRSNIRGCGRSKFCRCVGRLCSVKKSGALANRRDCRLGAGHGSGVLEYHSRNTYLGSNSPGRRVDWILQTILGRSPGIGRESLLAARLCVSQKPNSPPSI